MQRVDKASCDYTVTFVPRNVTCKTMLDEKFKAAKKYTVTFVPRNVTCDSMLDEKFKAAKKEKLPAPAQKAETFKAALEEVRP
jgi:hypothetical protein